MDVLNMFKKRIGITQNVLKDNRYNEVRNCLDINWIKLLTQIEILPIPLPLMPITHVKKMWALLKLDGIILSGGNTLVECMNTSDNPEKISPERDSFEKVLISLALLNKVPILGVCRGLQLLNIYYKGKLQKIKGHAGTRHNLIKEDPKKIFQLPSEVNSFHNYSVPRQFLGKGLVPLAHDIDNNIEAFYHHDDKVLAIMWHPEREPVFLSSDCELIKKHFEI